MPYDPAIEPLVPSVVIGTNPLDLAPVGNGLHEVSAFLPERAWDWEVAIGGQDLDIVSAAVPSDTPGVEAPIPRDGNDRHLLSKTDVAELTFVGRSGNPNNVNNAVKMGDKQRGNSTESTIELKIGKNET